MSSVSSDTGGGKRGALSQDLELNIASIIDCLTVLITYSLAVASFISIGALEANIAAPAQATLTPDLVPPLAKLSLELSDSRAITVRVSGEGEDKVYPIAARADGRWDYEAMVRQISELKASAPALDSVAVSAHDSVKYQDIIQAVEALKGTLPVVFSGGEFL